MYAKSIVNLPFAIALALAALLIMAASVLSEPPQPQPAETSSPDVVGTLDETLSKEAREKLDKAAVDADHASRPADLVKATLLADHNAAQPGKSLTVAVKLDIKEGWYVYWKHPGDAGQATSVSWTLPEGWTAGPLRWPPPTTFTQPGDIVGYGYKGSIMLGASITPPADATPDKDVVIRAEVAWLACEDKCIPGEAELSLTLPVAGKAESAEPANQQAFDAWRKKLAPKAPAFTLSDQDGRAVSLEDYLGKIVVLEWFNPDCPYIKRHHAGANDAPKTFDALAAKYADKDVIFMAVNSTHYMKPEVTKQWHEKWKMSFPVLIDRSGEVGRAYEAKATPHMFVINEAGEIAYQGAIDDDPRGKKQDVHNHVDAALAELTAGKPVSTTKTKPYGCSVKYAPKK